MSEEKTKQKKSVFDNPLLSTKIKSANAKLFPEAALGYFLGPTLALLTNSVITTYYNQYMTDVLNITAWANAFFTWLPLISVIFVVAGNILVGRLMDRCKTKAGKARPLLLVAIPLAVLSLLLLFIILPFTTDKENTGAHMFALVCIAIGYNLWFGVTYPFYFTSHSSLVNLSTRSSKDRSLLATIANATSLAAMGLSSMILPFLVGRFLITGDLQASYNAWKIFVIALVVLTAVGIITEYYFTRERITEESFANGIDQYQKKSTPIGKQARACFKDKFWWIMVVFFFVYQLGGMMKNISQPYFCKLMFENADGIFTSQNGQDLSGTIAIVGAIPTALGMVVAWPLSNKIGKGRAILFGAILSVIGGAIGFIAPNNYYVVIASFVVKAFGSTPAMYLSLALLADVLDHQEAVNGFRTDGLTMTIYGAIMAGMAGIATAILNGILSAVGYQAPVGELGQFFPTEAMQTAMKWIFIGGETICYGVIVIIFLFMGVEKFSRFDHKAIVQDQRAVAEAEGRVYEDPADVLARQEEEFNVKADEERRNNLKAKCEKQGISFEEEEAKYQKAKADKEAAAAAKKAAAEEKKAAALKAKEDQIAAMSEEERAKLKAKEEEKARKKAEREAATLAEFNKIRQQYGKASLATEE